MQATNKERRFLDPKVVARLMQQPLGTRLPMVGTVAGLHKSPHRGSSVEFAEYRKYVPGDDIRRLDWRVYARTDRFYMKEYEADTNLRCYLVLDCSNSMRFKSAGDAKIDYARRLICSLAYMLIQQGDAAGLMCVGKEVVQDVPPKRNPTHLQTIFDMVETVPVGGETALVSALHDFSEKIRQRALVVVFSDFFCPVEPLLDCLQHLRFEKHDVALFHLMDPMEIDFPFDRPTRFVDLESPATLLAEPAIIRAQYQQQLKQHMTALREGCNRFAVELMSVVTDQSYEAVLREFLKGRAMKAK
ncbi:MAG: DUF58 domain-containing protein [Verrucomicrobiota bacterium]